MTEKQIAPIQMCDCKQLPHTDKCAWAWPDRSGQAVNLETVEDDFLAGVKACDLSGDGTCEACQ